MISPEDKFIIRQGDLIVTNYVVYNYRQRGLDRAYLTEVDGIYIFRMTHYIIPEKDRTILIHPEHGVTVIPTNFHCLRFYTFNNVKD
jgi:hypothetical protein